MNAMATKSDKLPHTAAVYSQAVTAGDLVFVAGQVGMNYDTGNLPDEFEAQARQALENLSIVLRASGSSMQHVVKTTVWLRNAGDFEAMNRLYAEYFPERAPARSTPIVDLPKPNLLISIEAIAVTDKRG